MRAKLTTGNRNPDHGALRRLRAVQIATALFVLPVITIVILAGCSKSAPPPALPKPAVLASVAATNEYVGSEACGQCHPNERNLHWHSHHAMTLRPLTVSALGKLAPHQTLFQDINAAIAIDGDHFVLLNPKTGQTRRLDYAMGSGKQGMTFTAAEANGIFEMRVSYLPRTHDWYPTPGQEAEANNPNVTGKLWATAIARGCVSCHAVKVPADFSPEPKFMGVGCESCHGPGSAHIAAINAGSRTDNKMEHLSAANTNRIEAICARCHRTTADVAAMAPKLRLSNRFMVYGLEMSRCFRSSNGRLNCISCHDPHADASTDRRSYERVCLQCHGTTAPAPASPTARTVTAVERRHTCPVNPREGCIRCHMPTNNVFGGNGNSIPIAMADHWIKVNRKF